MRRSRWTLIAALAFAGLSAAPSLQAQAIAPAVAEPFMAAGARR